MTRNISKNFKGNILRVKQGFNPNSSSVGSQIPVFFYFILGSGSLTVMVLNLLSMYDKKIRENLDKDKSRPDRT